MNLMCLELAVYSIIARLLKVLFVSQRAAHVYSEAKRVYAFRDTVSSNLRWALSLDISYSLYDL